MGTGKGGETQRRAREGAWDRERGREEHGGKGRIKTWRQDIRGKAKGTKQPKNKP